MEGDADLVVGGGSGHEYLRGSGIWDVRHTFGWAIPRVLDRSLRGTLNIEGQFLFLFLLTKGTQLNFSPRTKRSTFISDTPRNGCEGYHRIMPPLHKPFQRLSNFFRGKPLRDNSPSVFLKDLPPLGQPAPISQFKYTTSNPTAPRRNK